MKTKKMLASAMAFIMATSAMAGNVFAAGEKVTISAQKVELSADQASFSIDISLAGVPASGVNACEFAVTYDSHFMKVTGVTAGKITQTGADAAESDISGELPAFYSDFSQDGTVLATWTTGLDDKNYWIHEDGVFMTITGVVAPGTTSGSCDIKVVPIDREQSDNTILVGVLDANGGEVDYDVAVTNGSVSFGAVTTTTSDDPIVTTTTPPGTDDEPLIGDVNLDGVIALTDVVVLNKGIISGNLTDAQKRNAECFADGVGPDTKDAQALLKYSAGLYKTLPIKG